MSEREKLIEVMARAICKSEEVPADEVAYTWEDGSMLYWQTYITAATAALTALEAAGVRLVPAEATMEMTHAVWATDLPRPDIYGDYADLDIQMSARDIYRSMLAASPYAPEET